MISYFYSRSNLISDGIKCVLETEGHITYINNTNPNKLIELINVNNKISLLNNIDYKRIEKLQEIEDIVVELHANEGRSCLVIENLSLILNLVNLDYNLINYQLIEIVKLIKLNKMKLIIIDATKNKFISNIVDEDTLVG